MAAKLKVDQVESVDGSTNIILNNSVTMATNKTLPAPSLTGNLPAISGANLTALNATNLGSGTVPTARLGSGTASNSVFLRGDGSWQAAGSTSASDLTSGTLPMARLSGTLPALAATNLTAIPAANITGTLPAISGANLTGVNAVNGGRKNLIINGAMQVAQRSTSAVAQANDSNEGYATLDRYSLEFGNSAGGTITTSKDSESPTGFGSSYKLDVTTADTSLEATHLIFFAQCIEAQTLRSCGWDYTSASSYLTLSFWVKNSKTGIYCVAFNTYDTARQYTAEYTISSANTWEKKTITIPGNSALTFNDDNGQGLEIHFMLAVSSGRYGSAGSWTSGNAWGTSNQVNFLDSTSNVGYWTGVQLELGSVATDFEHRSYGEELALCQRYYYKYSGEQNIHGCTYNATKYIGCAFFPVPMRANPTVGDLSGSYGTIEGIVKSNLYFVKTSNNAYLTTYSANAEL